MKIAVFGRRRKFSRHAMDWLKAVTLTLFPTFLFQCDASSQPHEMPVPTLLAEYDFIIVGAGSAGSVVANKLSANNNYKVLVLEAGGEMTPELFVPYLSPFSANENNSWGYQTTPQEYSLFVQKVAPITLGKVIGGTGSLNSMNFVRGTKKDFDQWETEYKAHGWSYSAVLPYFKEIEYFNVSDVSEEEKKEFHGFTRATPINYPGYYTNLSYAFLKACEQLNYKYVDYNGRNREGFSRVQSNTAFGVRMGPSTCFLSDDLRKERQENLHILTKSEVTKINIKNKKAVGVEFIQNGQKKTATATREVILCAGAVNSPKLLMLSGIGLEQHLRKLGIPLIENLPVGQGLQDHVIFLGLVVTTTEDLIGLKNFNASLIEYNQSHTGLLTIPGAFETLLFAHSDDTEKEMEDPDLELELASIFPSPEIEKSPYVSPYVYKHYYEPMFGHNGFMNAVAMVHPKSRGAVHLNSRDPSGKPFIDPNMLDDPLDTPRIVKGIMKLKKLFETKAMMDIGAKVWEKPFPYCQQFTPIWSENYTTCFVQHTAFPGQHVCCTCGMGTHHYAVVDPDLRVKNIKGLRVIDASVMPSIVSGNTYATVLMIAAKGADMILKDHQDANGIKT